MLEENIQSVQQKEPTFTPSYPKSENVAGKLPEKPKKKSYLDEAADEFKPIENNSERKIPKIDTRNKKSADTPLHPEQEHKTQPLEVTLMLQERQIRLAAVNETIHTYTQDSSEKMFSITKNYDQQAPLPEVRVAVNSIYSSLTQKLAEVAHLTTQESLNMSNPEWQQKDYEKITQSIEPLIKVWDQFAQGKLALEHDQTYEQKKRNVGDEIYAYVSKKDELDGTPYKRITVFIRPHDFNPKEHTDVKHKAQARTVISAEPRDVSASKVSLRIDPDTNQYTNNQRSFIFDLDVGEDMLNITPLPSTDHTKRTGHHLQSGLTEENLGVSSDQVFQAMIIKAEENVLPIHSVAS